VKINIKSFKGSWTPLFHKWDIHPSMPYVHSSWVPHYHSWSRLVSYI